MLLWWQIDQDELAKQVSEYQTLKITQSARGLSFLLLLFSAVLTSLVIVLGTWDSINFVDVFIICLLAYFIYRGHQWAMIGAMIYLSLSKFYLAYEALQTHSPQTYVAHLAWWAIYMHPVYLALKVERLRNKGIITENVSKKSRNIAAWIIGIIGLFIVLVIFKVRTESPQKGFNVEEALSNANKAQNEQATAPAPPARCIDISDVTGWSFNDNHTMTIIKRDGFYNVIFSVRGDCSIFQTSEVKVIDNPLCEEGRIQIDGKICHIDIPAYISKQPAPTPSRYVFEESSQPSQTKYESPTPNEKFNNSQTALAPVPAPEPQLPVKRITERVVTDKETGLVWTWEANLAGKPIDRENADYFIEQLNEESYAGYKDWRLPTAAEFNVTAV